MIGASTVENIKGRLAALAAPKTDTQSEVGLGAVAMLVGFLCLVLVIKPVEPADDLLRHLIAYLHQFDYRQMYIYSSFPSFDMYIGFDMIVGCLHQVIGQYAYVVVQAVGVLIFSGAFLYLLRGVNSDLRLSLLLVALASILPRLLLGRPSSLESSLMLLGFAMGKDERIKFWLHGLLGLLMIPLYYLYPIYMIPLILVRRIYGFTLLAGLGFWHWYSNGGYWKVTGSVLLSGAGRVVEINELSGIAPALVQSLYAVIPADRKSVV